MPFHAPDRRFSSDESSAPPGAGDARARRSDDQALGLLGGELTAELHALKAGVPGACRRFEDAVSRCVEHLGKQGMSPDRVLSRIKQLIYGHVPWEPFRDPSHMDRLAFPIITACIDTYYSEQR
jgi:hypothetical protein